MKQSRRKFIVATGSALAGSAFQRSVADGGTTGSAPDITALLEASGFTPGGPNSALLAVIGDVHINLNAGTAYMDHLSDALVAELNELTPKITDLGIAGDLIVHHSVSIGGPRYSSHYELSRLEFRTAKTQIARFRADMKFYAVPGNHDTDREETDAELWREELQLPPYQKSVLGGVPVFFLNSGHAGMPDPTQRAWFEEQARLIPSDQEVVIIAHHPSFFYIYEEIGLKRIVANALSKHRAPVWLVGGHGHAFGEQLLVSGSARFVQMEVTKGNPGLFSFGDARHPGYILLALQNGRVVHRAFRSVVESGFQSLKPVNQLTSYPLKWVFDTIEYPAVALEEGFYERAGRLVNFVGIDLKSHLVLCKSHTVRVDLSNSKGKISEYLLPCHVWNGYAPPTCDFSATSASGPWTSVSFPAQTGQAVYRIPIPVQFRNSPNLYIRTKTQLQGTWDGLSIYGWGLAADPSTLTLYEKWNAKHYRTILLDDRSNPSIKPAGSSLANIQHFAFNIPLPNTTTPATQAIVLPGTSPPVSGTPSFSRSFRTVMKFRFARRTAASEPFASYAVEHSTDLAQWTTVHEDRLSITPLESGWEEVMVNLASAAKGSGFCRVKITSIDTAGGNVAHISTGDLDGNGIDDLTQYAFDLNEGNGLLRRYDPNRLSHQAGLPIQEVRSGLYSILRFARLRASSNPGVIYSIEQTSNLRDWTRVPKSGIAERILHSNGDWDYIEAIILDTSPSFRFYRVGLTVSPP